MARNLGPEEYGLYAFLLSMLSLLTLPTQAGLPQFIIREVARYECNQEWDLMSGLLIRAHQMFSIVTLIIICILTAIGITQAEWHFEDGWILMMLGMPMLILVPLTSIRSSILRGLCKPVIGQLPNMLIRPVCFIIVLIFLLVVNINLTPAHAIIGQVISCFFAFIIGNYLLNKNKPIKLLNSKPQYDQQAWLKALIPFSLLGIVTLLTNELSIILLGMLSINSEVGWFRVASIGASLVAIPLFISNGIIAPHITQYYHKNNPQRCADCPAIS